MAKPTKKSVAKKAVAAVVTPGVDVDLSGIGGAPKVVVPKEGVGLIPAEVVVPDSSDAPLNARLVAQLGELEASRVSIEASKIQLATGKLALERDLLVLELAKTESEHRRVLAETVEQQRSHPVRTTIRDTPPPRGLPALPFGAPLAGLTDSSDAGRARRDAEQEAHPREVLYSPKLVIGRRESTR